MCRFSGLRVYPGKGIRFIRGDSQQFLFINAKSKRLFHQKKKPSKIAWTAQYRKARACLLLFPQIRFPLALALVF